MTPASPDVTSYPQFRAWREPSESHEHMVAVRTLRRNLTGAGDPEELLGEAMTEGYFEMYGIAPVVGRWFSAEQSSPDGPPAVILSHALWSARFGSDRSLIGRTIQLNGTAIPVVGVMAPGFGTAQFWMPLHSERNGLRGARRYGSCAPRRRQPITARSPRRRSRGADVRRGAAR